MARKPNPVDVQESLDQLRKELPPGTPVYTVVRHVSQSGMVRDISLHYVTKQGDIGRITNRTATVLHRSVKNDGVRCHGVGMDMGFEVVYNLSLALHGDGYALTQRWL